MPSALHPQTLLCYEMNGEPLSIEHGGPLRLVTAVKYGIKSIKRIGRSPSPTSARRTSGPSAATTGMPDTEFSSPATRMPAHHGLHAVLASAHGCGEPGGGGFPNGTQAARPTAGCNVKRALSHVIAEPNYL